MRLRGRRFSVSLARDFAGSFRQVPRPSGLCDAPCFFLIVCLVPISSKTRQKGVANPFNSPTAYGFLFHAALVIPTSANSSLDVFAFLARFPRSSLGRFGTLFDMTSQATRSA